MSRNNKILIIGNGPSARELADIGFDRLRADVDTFGMGIAYRYYREINWWPTWYALGDSKVVFSHRQALAELVENPTVTTERFFLSWPVTEHPRLEVVKHSSTGDLCFRTALDLGYREIYMIGIEGQYVEEILESRPLTEDEYFSLGFDQLGLKESLRTTLRIITETPEDNPNYFFHGYQQAGDVYTLPQSGIHRRRWNMSAQLAHGEDIRALNLSPSSRVNEFPKSTLTINVDQLLEDHTPGLGSETSVNGNYWYGPFEREDEMRIDESEIVLELLSDATAPARNVLVNAGADMGAALSRFEQQAWVTHAFKPSPLALTLDDFVRSAGIEAVDFLKVDDFDLLKGLDLTKLPVSVILTEFDNSRGKPPGHNMADRAAYLETCGYDVYVSEWHPIVHDEGDHQWCALKHYPCELAGPESCGKLLAFRSDPGIWVIVAALQRVKEQELKRVEIETAASAASAESQTIPHQEPVVAIADNGSTEMPYFIRIVRGICAAAWRRRRWITPVGLLLALIAAAGFAPALADYRAMIWGAEAFAIAMAAVLYLALRMNHLITLLRSDIDRLRHDNARALQNLRESHSRELEAAVRNALKSSTDLEKRAVHEEESPDRLSRALRS